MIRHPPISTLFPYTTLSRSGLSLSVTVMNIVPASGRAAPAAACALANAVGKSRATPMTSPVERISGPRSEEHTSELQSRQYLVCRLLLEKKNSQLSRLHHP